MIDFSAVCNVLATSRLLFRNLGPHLQRRSDYEDMVELFDRYVTIGSFWSGIDLLREHCITEQYREGLQHLNYRGVNIPKGKDLRKIAEKYTTCLTKGPRKERHYQRLLRVGGTAFKERASTATAKSLYQLAKGLDSGLPRPRQTPHGRSLRLHACGAGVAPPRQRTHLPTGDWDIEVPLLSV